MPSRFIERFKKPQFRYFIEVFSIKIVVMQAVRVLMLQRESRGADSPFHTESPGDRLYECRFPRCQISSEGDHGLGGNPIEHRFDHAMKIFKTRFDLDNIVCRLSFVV